MAGPLRTPSSLNTASPASEATLPFITLSSWVRAARQCGIDLARVLEEAGIDPRHLNPETGLISREALQHILLRCIEEARLHGAAQHFPMALGQAFAFEYLADVDTFITTSASLREAARSLDWIPPLINPLLRLSLSEHGQQARLCLSYDAPDNTPGASWALAEATFVTLLKFTRRLLDQPALRGSVTFRHAAHADPDVHAAFQAFFGAPVSFGAELNALYFDRSLLDRPLHGTFPLLNEQAARRVSLRVAEQTQPSEHIGAPQRTPLLEEIEALLARKPRLLGQGLDALAQELNLHPRTLQRRLQETGHSHSILMRATRRRLALQWLQDPSLSIEAISGQLGFTHRRSFTLAFTRWQGISPSQHRREITRFP